MKFHIWRCLGIVALGLAAFFLAVLEIYSLLGASQWEAFDYVFRDYGYLVAGYIAFMAFAAILLSVEEETEKKGAQRKEE